MKFTKIIKCLFITTLAINFSGGIIVGYNNCKNKVDNSIDWNSVSSQINLDAVKPKFNSENAKIAYENASNKALNDFSQNNYTLDDLSNYAKSTGNLISGEVKSQSSILQSQSQSSILQSQSQVINSQLIKSQVIKSQTPLQSQKFYNSNNNNDDLYKLASKNLNDLIKMSHEIEISIIVSAAAATVLAAGYFAAAFFDFGVTIPQAAACIVVATTFAAAAVGLSIWENQVNKEIAEITNDNWWSKMIDISTIAMGTIIGVMVLCYAVAIATVWADPAALYISDVTFAQMLTFAGAIVLITTLITAIITLSNNASVPNIPPTPWTPFNPVTPDTPWTPIDPSTPATPWTPIQPGIPITPWTPIDPSTPVTPWTPIQPGIPISPWTPVGPSTPVTPDKPAVTPQFNFITFEIIGATVSILIAIIVALIIFSIINYRRKNS